MRGKLLDLRQRGCYGDGSDLSSTQHDILCDKSDFKQKKAKGRSISKVKKNKKCQ